MGRLWRRFLVDIRVGRDGGDEGLEASARSHTYTETLKEPSLGEGSLSSFLYEQHQCVFFAFFPSIILC